jgi:hypothetical protein
LTFLHGGTALLRLDRDVINALPLGRRQAPNERMRHRFIGDLVFDQFENGFIARLP